MYYEKDLESVGGLFIKERVLEKTRKYEIIKCLLYVGGEKFHVELQEFRKGKGIIVNVIAESREEKLENIEKLNFILEKYSRNENSPIRHYQRERADIKMKSDILMAINILLIFHVINNISELLHKGLIFTTNGVIAGMLLFTSFSFIFVIKYIRSKYIRG